MKRFRFPAQPLLERSRVRLEQAEAALARLRARQESSRERAERLAAEAGRTRREALAARPLAAGGLRAAEGWSDHLEAERVAALEARRRLAREIEKAVAAVTAERLEVERLERLRERRLLEHRREADRRAEAAAGELAVLRHGRR